ncbi:fimbrial protein [Bordetella trematum]|uniref:fimbrial protein n=1 Tax=Bordetella trematum TaxID=123899 RepID=UPI003988BA9B
MPRRLPIALPVVCLGMALSPLAHAVDGTITINGEIIDSTCKINGAAPPADILVTLPKIGQTALKNEGDVAGATAFVIALTECPATLSGKVKAYFEPGPTTAYDTGNLYAYTTTEGKTKASSIPSDQASQTQFQKVQIQLANPDSSAIKIGAPDNKATGVELQSGTDGKKSATLRYLARYYKSSSGTITPGKLYTYVQYSIVYP